MKKGINNLNAKMKRKFQQNSINAIDNITKSDTSNFIDAEMTDDTIKKRVWDFIETIKGATNQMPRDKYLQFIPQQDKLLINLRIADHSTRLDRNMGGERYISNIWLSLFFGQNGRDDRINFEKNSDGSYNPLTQEELKNGQLRNNGITRKFAYQIDVSHLFNQKDTQMLLNALKIFFKTGKFTLPFPSKLLPVPMSLTPQRIFQQNEEYVKRRTLLIKESQLRSIIRETIIKRLLQA